MTDWKTTKIKGGVKDDAAELDATFTEIMQAGIDHLNGCNTQTRSNTNEVTTSEIEELKDELSMANDPNVEVDVDGLFDRIDTLEGRIKDLHTEMKTLQERLER